MLCQDRPRLVIFLAASLSLIWSFRLFDIPDAIFSIFNDGSFQPQHESEFIRQAVKVEFPTPIDYRPIQEVCARTKFRPGLVFTCEGQHGGIGMVRNQILKCVRYAIHGGGAMVVPSMALRNAKDISDIETTTEVPLEYLLDREAFITHLSGSCPGMRIYNHVEDFPFYDKRVRKDLSLVGDQFEPNHPREGLKHPREWRSSFDRWLRQQYVKIQSDMPVHVKMEQAFLEYPVHEDGEAFVNEFGKILSFRKETRALAARILWELKRRFNLPIDPSKAINEHAFYGAHLRLEDDAINAWPPEQWRFSRMADQFEEQFQNIERTNLSVVYIASGNQTVVDLFASALKSRLLANPNSMARNVTVVTKHDLLWGPYREKLNGMTFDQQALVDFLVMFKASSFMGVAHSSFPWNVALRRHELSKFKTYANNGSNLLRDEYSVIMGMQADYLEVDPFVTGIWP